MCGARRRRRRQARAPRASAVVQSRQVGHADGETVANFEGLTEPRGVVRVSARLGADVEVGGQRESARGAGLATRGTGRDEAGHAAGGGRPVRYFGRAAAGGRRRSARALTVAAVLTEVLRGQVGARRWTHWWRRRGRRFEGIRR